MVDTFTVTGVQFGVGLPRARAAKTFTPELFQKLTRWGYVTMNTNKHREREREREEKRREREKTDRERERESQIECASVCRRVFAK